MSGMRSVGGDLSPAIAISSPIVRLAAVTAVVGRQAPSPSGGGGGGIRARTTVNAPTTAQSPQGSSRLRLQQEESSTSDTPSPSPNLEVSRKRNTSPSQPSSNHPATVPLEDQKDRSESGDVEWSDYRNLLFPSSPPRAHDLSDAHSPLPKRNPFVHSKADNLLALPRTKSHNHASLSSAKIPFLKPATTHQEPPVPPLNRDSIACPLCQRTFPQSFIERHAANCTGPTAFLSKAPSNRPSSVSAKLRLFDRKIPLSVAMQTSRSHDDNKKPSSLEIDRAHINVREKGKLVKAEEEEEEDFFILQGPSPRELRNRVRLKTSLGTSSKMFLEDENVGRGSVQHANTKPPPSVPAKEQCPICQEWFPLNRIERHVNEELNGHVSSIDEQHHRWPSSVNDKDSAPRTGVQDGVLGNTKVSMDPQRLPPPQKQNVGISFVEPSSSDEQHGEEQGKIVSDQEGSQASEPDGKEEGSEEDEEETEPLSGNFIRQPPTRRKRPIVYKAGTPLYDSEEELSPLKGLVDLNVLRQQGNVPADLRPYLQPFAANTAGLPRATFHPAPGIYTTKPSTLPATNSSAASTRPFAKRKFQGSSRGSGGARRFGGRKKWSSAKKRKS